MTEMVTAHHTWIKAVTQQWRVVSALTGEKTSAQLLKYEKMKKKEHKLVSKYMGKDPSAEVKHMQTQGAVVSTKAQGTACSCDSQHQA